MPRPRSPICPKRFRRARRLYENGASQGDVATVLGLAQGTVQRRLKDWGWERNAELTPVPPPAPPPTPKFRFIEESAADAPIPARPEAGGDLALRLRRLVEREMMRLESRPGSSSETARTLSSLVRIVAQLNEMQPPAPAPLAVDDEDEQDIDEFRLELARRFRGLVAEAEEEKLEQLAANPPFRLS